MTTCVVGTPLFDWSGHQLDQLMIRSLHQYHVMLHHLLALFTSFTTVAAVTTEEGNLLYFCQVILLTLVLLDPDIYGFELILSQIICH